MSTVKPNRRPLDWGWVLALPCAALGLFLLGLSLVSLTRGEARGLDIGVAVFGLFWALIGVPWTVASYRNNRYTLARNRLARAFPSEPWRWRPEWQARRIVRRSRRFGEVGLELHTWPAPLGGELRGTIRTRLSTQSFGGFELHLSVVHFQLRGVGKRQRILMDTLWETKQSATAAGAAGGLVVEIALPIPADLPESNDNHPNNEILWRLRITGDVDGRRFEALFDVPVFRVG